MLKRKPTRIELSQEDVPEYEEYKKSKTQPAPAATEASPIVSRKPGKTRAQRIGLKKSVLSSEFFRLSVRVTVSPGLSEYSFKSFGGKNLQGGPLTQTQQQLLRQPERDAKAVLA
eukprot:g23668.t1